jgi:hypothetical protein
MGRDPRVIQQHVDHGGGKRRSGNAQLVHHAHPRCARISRHEGDRITDEVLSEHREARDVAQGERHQKVGILRRLPGLAYLGVEDRGKEVAVREHRSLRHARGARRVDDPGNLAVIERGKGRARGVWSDETLQGRAQFQRAAHSFQLRAHAFDHARERRGVEQTRRAGVVDDADQFRHRKAVVEEDESLPRSGDPVVSLDILRLVVCEDRHVIARLPVGSERAGEAQAAVAEFGERLASSVLADECRTRATSTRIQFQNVVQSHVVFLPPERFFIPRSAVATAVLT